MRIPGIQTIAYIACHNLGSELELDALSGMTPDITPYQFTPVLFVGEPTLELTDSNEHNGTNRHALLTFSTTYPFSQRRVAFLVTTASGAIYLIGGATTIPAISTKDTTAGAGTINAETVTVELTAPVAWSTIRGNIVLTAPDTPVGYEPWRPMTSAEIDELINSLKSS